MDASSDLRGAGRTRNTLSPGGAWILGLATALAGAGVIAAAVLSDDGGANAPRWIVAAAGAAFVLGGAAVIREYALDRGRAPADDLWGPLFAFAISACLAAVAGWIALGPGERQFHISAPLPVAWLPPAAGQWIGRSGFGIGAGLASAMALAFAVALLRRLRRRTARAALGPALALVALGGAVLGVLHLTGDLRLWPAARALRHAVAAPGLTDVDRLRLVLEAKLANPSARGREREHRRPSPERADEEVLAKEIRSRLAAAVVPPPGALVTRIPIVTSRRPAIDGRIEPGEWSEALSLDLGQGTRLYAQSDGQRLYLACDVPADTTADGFDQLRFFLHVGLGGMLANERVHVGREAADALASYRLSRVTRPGDRTPSSLSESRIYQRAQGASTMRGHRQFEASLDLAESGLHPGVPFAAFAEVESDPLLDASGRFKRRVYAGKLASEAAPIWLAIGQ